LHVQRRNRYRKNEKVKNNETNENRDGTKNNDILHVQRRNRYRNNEKLENNEKLTIAMEAKTRKIVCIFIDFHNFRMIQISP
jgi:hypothetical protein